MKKIVLYLLLCFTVVSCITTAGCLGYFDFYDSSLELFSSDSSVFLFEGEVIRVADGDTITIALLDKTTERIRLLGIDTPEMDPSSNRQREYGSLSRDHLGKWAQKAKDFTTEQLLHEMVTVSYDPAAGKRDQYDRVLGYVTLADGRDFNLMLIEEGYARVYVAESFDRKQDYINALRIAQDYEIGMWKG